MLSWQPIVWLDNKKELVCVVKTELTTLLRLNFIEILCNAPCKTQPVRGKKYTVEQCNSSVVKEFDFKKKNKAGPILPCDPNEHNIQKNFYSLL